MVTTKAEQALPFLADPERKAEDERRQEQRRAAHSRARLTDAEKMISRGAQVEKIALANLAMKRVPKELRAHHKRQLAHGLSLQGRYEEAAKHSPDKEQRKHYRAISTAIARDDELCKCPRREVQDPLTGTALSISPRRHLRDVYSPKHGAVVALMACENGCPLNARPLTGQAKEIAVNTRSAHFVQGDARLRLRTDAQVLGKR